MEFNLSEEQTMLRDSARRFLSDTRLASGQGAANRQERGFCEESWCSFVEFGWLGLALPEDVGGLGLTLIETAILMEEFGRALTLAPYVSSAVLCARVLDRCGNGAARSAALQDLCAGRRRFALAHSEPGRPHDDVETRTHAQRRDAGFVLDGAKILVLDAAAADDYIVSARLDDEEGYSLFLVDRHTIGVTTNDYPLIDGSVAADVRLEEVTVPSSALLTGCGVAAQLLEEAIDRAVLARCADAVGAMEAVMQMTADHLKSRTQFGQALARFQALQHRVAEMFVEVQEARSIVLCGLAHADHAEGRRDAVVSAAKVVVARAGRLVGELGVQLHGGMGVTAECAVGQYYKRLLAFEMFYGDVETHLARLAARTSLQANWP